MIVDTEELLSRITNIRSARQSVVLDEDRVLQDILMDALRVEQDIWIDETIWNTQPLPDFMRDPILDDVLFYAAGRYYVQNTAEVCTALGLGMTRENRIAVARCLKVIGFRAQPYYDPATLRTVRGWVSVDRASNPEMTIQSYIISRWAQGQIISAQAHPRNRRSFSLFERAAQKWGHHAVQQGAFRHEAAQEQSPSISGVQQIHREFDTVRGQYPSSQGVQQEAHAEHVRRRQRAGGAQAAPIRRPFYQTAGTQQGIYQAPGQASRADARATMSRGLMRQTSMRPDLVSVVHPVTGVKMSVRREEAQYLKRHEREIIEAFIESGHVLMPPSQHAQVSAPGRRELAQWEQYLSTKPHLVSKEARQKFLESNVIGSRTRGLYPRTFTKNMISWPTLFRVSGDRNNPRVTQVSERELDSFYRQHPEAHPNYLMTQAAMEEHVAEQGPIKSQKEIMDDIIAAKVEAQVALIKQDRRFRMAQIEWGLSPAANDSRAFQERAEVFKKAGLGDFGTILQFAKKAKAVHKPPRLIDVKKSLEAFWPFLKHKDETELKQAKARLIRQGADLLHLQKQAERGLSGEEFEKWADKLYDLSHAILNGIDQSLLSNIDNTAQATRANSLWNAALTYFNAMDEFVDKGWSAGAAARRLKDIEAA